MGGWPLDDRWASARMQSTEADERATESVRYVCVADPNLLFSSLLKAIVFVFFLCNRWLRRQMERQQICVRRFWGCTIA